MTVVPVLTAVSDSVWESRLVAALERGDLGVAVVRRCVDIADLLATAATGHQRGAPAVVLAAGATEVAVRIGALRRPAPRLAWWRLGLPTGLLLATAVAVAVAMRDTERLFELAERAYLAGQR